jgi:muconolactone delta-isomerase
MQFVLVADLRPGTLESGRPANFEQLVEQEKLHVRKAYLEGSIRQIWLQTPGPGAVAILEAGSLQEAEKAVAGFPLARAGLLEVRIIALAPFAGFAES